MFGMIKNSLLGSTEETPYKVLSTETKEDVNYEVRRYDGGKFACVDTDSRSFDEASREAVLKLLKYMGGSNDKGVGMGMTAPVSMITFPKADGSLSGKLKVGLRLPTKFQVEPPKPIDEGIRIEDRPGMTVYSTQFGGYAKEADYRFHANRLMTVLGDGAPYQRNQYLCNGYDPPMKPYGRRNEVWLLQEEP
ncbi:heme-binding protein 1-like [Erpetoichthys calabaricus]|uniref:Heme-binding protein 1 n=1 Tax=Erpetoichthys calabaricus TaxID=27687 RepID=A0A8C4S9X0_ERPCA|nr:heme-binding protein 1-like [Erpetoichthys calabaricus]